MKNKLVTSLILSTLVSVAFAGTAFAKHGDDNGSSSSSSSGVSSSSSSGASSSTSSSGASSSSSTSGGQSSSGSTGTSSSGSSSSGSVSGSGSHDDSNSGSSSGGSGSNSGSGDDRGGDNRNNNRNSRTRLKGNFDELLDVGSAKIKYENRTKTKKNQERQEQELDLRVKLPLTVEALALTPENGADLQLEARFTGDTDGDQVEDAISTCVLAFKADDDNSLSHQYRVKVKSRTGKEDRNYYGSSCDTTENMKKTERVTIVHISENEGQAEMPIFEYIK